ncbi:transposable element Tc1 transposase [Trichonephila clavipes]|uniref:Transposable element Tc1 transposase n=1 Tax=Trichonephila clavipes TaxID=2585209 RepID=A0A8X7BAD6_TRICX|nr:transposable element Tc1 transposase [Trichonephila clavipes]
MPRHRIQAHNEQLPEFERGCIIGLKEASWANLGESLVKWVEVMWPLEDTSKNGRDWRQPGQRADPAFTISRQIDPQEGVMVWGAISFDSRTPLVVIRGTLTAQRYVDDILRTFLLPLILPFSGLIFL